MDILQDDENLRTIVSQEFSKLHFQDEAIMGSDQKDADTSLTFEDSEKKPSGVPEPTNIFPAEDEEFVGDGEPVSLKPGELDRIRESNREDDLESNQGSVNSKGIKESKTKNIESDQEQTPSPKLDKNSTPPLKIPAQTGPMARPGLPKADADFRRLGIREQKTFADPLLDLMEQQRIKEEQFLQKRLDALLNSLDDQRKTLIFKFVMIVMISLAALIGNLIYSQYFSTWSLNANTHLLYISQ